MKKSLKEKLDKINNATPEELVKLLEDDNLDFTDEDWEEIDKLPIEDRDNEDEKS